MDFALTLAVWLTAMVRIAVTARPSVMTLATAANYDPLTCMTTLKRAVLPGLRGIEGNCLRYAFHDCGTYAGVADGCAGCTGGIKSTIWNSIKTGVYNTSSNSHGENNGMYPCQTLLVGLDGTGGVCAQVKKTEPACGGMPIADCINFVGYLSVVNTGGAPPGGCGWYPGRKDAPPTCLQATTRLPSDAANGDQLIATFKAYAMPDKPASVWGFKPLGTSGFALLPQTVAALIGSHTIGFSRGHQKSLCSKGLGPLGGTPASFDKDYYQQIVSNVNKVDNKGGWFCSDMHGLCNTIVYDKGITQTGVNPATQRSTSDLTKASCAGKADSPLAPIFTYYARAPSDTFKADFCAAYQSMSLIGYAFPKDYAKIAPKFKALLSR